MSSKLSLLFDGLNEQQKQAITHETGPAMVLAGAGSGKTRVLTTRAAWLMAERNIPAESLLLVTFTNKAAKEISDRLLHLSNQSLPFAGTFHRICAKILRKHGYLLGIPANFIILDSDDQLDLIKNLYKQKNWNEKEFIPRAVKSAISDAKNELLHPDEYSQTARGAFASFVTKVYPLYQHELHENHSLDFDDLLVKTVQLLQNYPQVLHQYQAQFIHVLIDEYQDTNKVQYVLSKLLSLPQNNLFVVGDFSQSIYAWRGADYRNMMLMTTQFPTLSTYRLEQNYRSTQTILDAATQVISKNTTHPVLNLWTESTGNEPLTLYEASSGEDEANKIAQYILTRDFEYDYSDRVVLYRTNAQSRAFEEAFIRQGIPYRIVGGVKFYARKEIKDLLAYLRLCLNENERLAKERVLKIGKRKFEAFIAWVKLNQVPTNSLAPAPALESILDQTKYKARFDPHDSEDLSRLENISELLAVASQFDSITSFLENVSLIQSEEMSDAPQKDLQNVVSLMSLHSAKGLEFPIVFMVGLEEGLLPHSRSLLDNDQLEEERRLCYVGITRAKTHLYLSHARKRLVYGSITPNLPSRFLSDIPEKLITKELSTLYETNSNFGYAASRANSPSWYNSKLGTANRTANKNRSQKSDSQSQAQVQAQSNSRRYVPLDEGVLDDLLSGELDIATFIEQ